jgi:hypothetical protein
MAFNDNAEHVRILAAVHKGIEGLRRRLQELQPELSTSASDVINTARQDVCGALVRRLELAEKDVQELQNMLELNRVERERPKGAFFLTVRGCTWPCFVLCETRVCPSHYRRRFAFADAP